jgi:uncharacterized membrane protein
MFLEILLNFAGGFKDMDFSDKYILVSGILIICHALTGFISSFHQSRLILRNDSAKCMPLEYVIVLMIGASIAMPYGWTKGLFISIMSGAIKTLGSLIFFYAVKKVNKKPLSRKQKFLVCAVIFLTVLGSNPDVIDPLIILILVFIFIFVMAVPWNMLKGATRGDVSLKAQLITFGGQIGWIGYGLYMGDSLLFLSYGAFTVLTIIILYFWLKFPQREIEEIDPLPLKALWCNFWHQKLWLALYPAKIEEIEEHEKIWKKRLTCVKCKREFYELGKCLPAADF